MLLEIELRLQPTYHLHRVMYMEMILSLPESWDPECIPVAA